MPLTAGLPMLRAACRDGYAVGAFNVFNLETVQAVAKAAQRENSPVVIQVWAGVLQAEYVDAVTMVAMTRSVSDALEVEVCLHLDHGDDLGVIRRACRAGFTSIMIEVSRWPLDENIRRTRAAVGVARDFGVSVEAEIGHVGGEGESQAVDLCVMTDPEQAGAFVEASGCDSVAVAVGTSHGRYPGPPQLDLDRLRSIRERVDVPLVLHASSYTPKDQLVAPIKLGVAKINVATELKDAWLESVAGTLSGSMPAYAQSVLAPATEAVRRCVQHKLRLFGSAGRGDGSGL